MKVILEKGTFEQSLWNLAGGFASPRFKFFFISPLLEFQRIIEGRGMFQSYGHILEKAATFLAGFKSLYELEGNAALISELEDDYTAQSNLHPICYPDGFFDWTFMTQGLQCIKMI